ncbi:uncharacterized protein LOC129003319 [Macrosteles quadrilineatus]|uniref:uncharacterized protein LOC129003319 n=1 Tax=Macrosteles quadrilineatus TaxID=74068 RepID=UPI0023E244C1|nr:uncharacterized protein LOC129003319 [Macrosteles quadrilineatus]
MGRLLYSFNFQAFISSLLLVFITGILTFSPISEEDGSLKLQRYIEPNVNYNQENYLSKHVDIETNIQKPEPEFDHNKLGFGQKPLVPQDHVKWQYKGTGEVLKITFGKITYDSFTRSRRKRSNLFNDLDDQNEKKIMTNDQEIMLRMNTENIPESQNRHQPWYWSWLFKSHGGKQKRSTEVQNVSEIMNKLNNNRSSGTNSTKKENFLAVPSNASNSLLEKLENNTVEPQSKRDNETTHDKEMNRYDSDSNFNVTFEKQSPDNITAILLEEANLEQQIKDHNPGITTTEALWNTDEFIEGISN